MQVQKGVGIQSFCFRGFSDNDAVATKLKQCGVSTIELCSVHVDFSNPDSFSGVIDAYRNAGVSIVSIGVNMLRGDEEAERHYFEFLKAAGAGFMSVTFDVASAPLCYRVAERLAEEYDVLLAIHNHGGRDWLGSAAMLGHVLATTSDRIGVCLDTAWALDSGEDPIALADRIGGRLYGVHFKDFVFGRDRKPEDVVVGTGNLDLPALAKIMEKHRFNGFAVIEYEGDVDDPVPALAECVAAVAATSIGK